MNDLDVLKGLDDVAKMKIVLLAVRECRMKLSGAFSWRATREGGQYWTGVYDRLLEIEGLAEAEVGMSGVENNGY